MKKYINIVILFLIALPKVLRVDDKELDTKIFESFSKKVK